MNLTQRQLDVLLACLKYSYVNCDELNETFAHVDEGTETGQIVIGDKAQDAITEEEIYGIGETFGFQL